jgi:3-mercaptopyruvate sulfurtransferase SseA
MIDFYRNDFANQLAELDPDVPYELSCRSGSRSGQTTAIMEELGFQLVQDVDGGSLAWQAAGLPLVTERVSQTACAFCQAPYPPKTSETSEKPASRSTLAATDER